MFIASGGWRSGVARLAAGLSLGILSAGCGDEAVSMAPDAASLGVIGAVPPVGQFDGSLPEPPADGGMQQPNDAAAPPEDASTPPDDASQGDPDAASALPDDGASISGVTLTNAPHIGFTNVGTTGLVVVSASFWVDPVGSNTYVSMFGDLENQSLQNQCIVLSDLFAFDGGADQLVVIEGDSYDSSTSLSTLSTMCIPPRGRGVWHGLISGVTPTFIEDAREIRYDFRGLNLDYTPSEVAPQVLYADPAMRDGGWMIKGIVRTGPIAIYNTEMVFFARSASGLIFDDTRAYPLDLTTLAPNSTLFYESFAFSFSDREPESLTHYVEFIKGSDPTPGTKIVFEPAADDEVGRRIARAARLRRELRDLRAQRLHQ